MGLNPSAAVIEYRGVIAISSASRRNWEHGRLHAGLSAASS